MKENYCLDCETEFNPLFFDGECPTCGSKDVVHIDDIEVDDYNGHFEGDIVSKKG